MKNKILIGSMLVLTLLLLMPSIPAIQQRTIKGKTFTDFVEKFDDVNLKEINNLGDDVKFPNLYEFLARCLALRFFHGLMIGWFSIPFEGRPIYEKFPIFRMRSIWLSLSAYYIADFIDGIVEKLGWNWEPLTDWIG